MRALLDDDVQGTSSEPQYGVGVGAGNLGGGAAPEFVVLSASTLHVYADGLPTLDKTNLSSGAADPCPIDFSGAAGRHRPGEPRGDRRAADGERHADRGGTPVKTGAGHVSLFEIDAVGGRSPAR